MKSIQSDSAKFGTVHLAYSQSADSFCVVTDKTRWRGTSTPTLARVELLEPDGRRLRLEDWSADQQFAHIKIDARGLPAKCVAYWGDVRKTWDATQWFSNGRWTQNVDCKHS